MISLACICNISLANQDVLCLSSCVNEYLGRNETQALGLVCLWVAIGVKLRACPWHGIWQIFVVCFQGGCIPTLTAFFSKSHTLLLRRFFVPLGKQSHRPLSEISSVIVVIVIIRGRVTERACICSFTPGLAKLQFRSTRWMIGT